MIGWSTCLGKCHDRAAKLWPYFDSYLGRIHRPAALLRQIIGLVPVAFNNAALQPLFSSGLLVLFYYCLTLLPNLLIQTKDRSYATITKIHILSRNAPMGYSDHQPIKKLLLLRDKRRMRKLNTTGGSTLEKLRNGPKIQKMCQWDESLSTCVVRVVCLQSREATMIDHQSHVTISMVIRGFY
ncbi:hypothetical protein TcasGA2_TC001780 [Tribolium castaneum]|uniref:Uncharacterized protein n=1 Tax=Tribolium castaneum TaxID=7070 RepID=D6W8F9_TRICA|nr:hypothetical protein TcasGA2_TC001780 [Tribolium castaneum]